MKIRRTRPAWRTGQQAQPAKARVRPREAHPHKQAQAEIGPRLLQCCVFDSHAVLRFQQSDRETQDMQNVHDADTEASHPTPLRAAPRDRPAAEADRAQQLRLLAALGAWDRALRRDDCGAWCISGKTGSIHTWGDGATWALFVDVPIGQALDGYQAAPRVLHRHPGLRRRGLPAVAPATHGRPGGCHPGRAGHPEAPGGLHRDAGATEGLCLRLGPAQRGEQMTVQRLRARFRSLGSLPANAERKRPSPPRGREATRNA